MIIAYVNSTTFTIIVNPTFSNAIEVFAKVLARLMVVSARTKVKSLVSIPIPTIGNLIVHVDYCTKNHQGSKINGGHGT